MSGTSKSRPSRANQAAAFFRIARGSNSCASSSDVRPARTSPTICFLNFGGYGLLVLRIVDSILPKDQVSTKSGQLQLVKMSKEDRTPHPERPAWPSRVACCSLDNRLTMLEAIQHGEG